MAEVATYDTAHASGDYEGLSLGVAYETTWLRLRGLLPGYRLRRNEDTFHGVGDAMLEIKVPVVTDADRGLAAGLGLLMTAPTGNASHDLGAGHFMALAGLWGELSGHRAFAQAQLGYGREIGSSEAHHGAGHAGELHPIVNPMNPSEIVGAAAAGYRVHELVRLLGGVNAAIPIATDGGESRAVALLGVDLLLGRFDVGLEGQIPFVGDPFSAKAIAMAGVRF